MRKLINEPQHVVRDMIEGWVDTLPGLALLANENVIIRSDLPAAGKYEKVALVSGGGSGHEPAHAGYIGQGMLSAVAVGDVFTSPSVDTVLAAIRAVAGPEGVLLIVKNYTGDKLNFGLAAELAQLEGIKVESVIVADDVALQDSMEPSRWRGIAGTVLVHKIAGSLADSGADLATVAQIARQVAKQVATMGVALGACTIPATGKPSFILPEMEMELGLGIHGEAGVCRAPLQTADELVRTLLDAILQSGDKISGQRVALLVNGLGGTPPMELAIVARSAVAQLRQRGFTIERLWTGNFMTALEMPGCSLTLLPVTEQYLQWLDSSVTAPAWPGGGQLPAQRQIRSVPPDKSMQFSAAPDPKINAAVLAIAEALQLAEPQLTALDSAAGDGDLGLSMQRGAEAILALPKGAWADSITALRAVSYALRKAIAGSSGPFYSTALLRAAKSMETTTEQGPIAWATALQVGVTAIAELGGAKPGDRTMLDALQPAADAFKQAIVMGNTLQQAWQNAVSAAEQGVTATAAMLPKLGRASYLGERAIGVEDAGAAAVLVWLKALTPFIK